MEGWNYCKYLIPKWRIKTHRQVKYKVQTAWCKKLLFSQQKYFSQTFSEVCLSRSSLCRFCWCSRWRETGGQQEVKRDTSRNWRCRKLLQTLTVSVKFYVVLLFAIKGELIIIKLLTKNSWKPIQLTVIIILIPFLGLLSIQ